MGKDTPANNMGNKKTDRYYKDNQYTDIDSEYYEEETLTYSGDGNGEYYGEEEPEYYEEETPEYYGEEDGEYYEEETPEYYGEEDGEYYEEEAPEYYGEEDGEYYEEETPEYYEEEDGEYYEEETPEYYGEEDGEYYEEETPEYYEGEKVEYYGEDASGYYEETAPKMTVSKKHAANKTAPGKEKPVKTAPGKSASAKSGSKKAAPVKTSAQKKKKKSSSVGVLDFMVIATGVAIVIVAIILGVILVQGAGGGEKQSLFAGVGEKLTDMVVPGETGIQSIIAAVNVIPETGTGEEEQPEESGYEENDYDKNVFVKMTMASVQKDLKIKFTNKDTGKLVGNVPFSVEIVKPDKTKEVWTDDDMDGVIHQKSIEPGDYTIAMSELDNEKYKKYLISTTAQKTEVKKEITYAQVDVTGEGKTENEVNAAVEDTGAHNTPVESELPDTVEWVASSQNTADYTQIDVSNIPNPDTLTVAGAFARVGARISEDLKEVKVGDSFTLTADYVDDATNATFSYSSISWATNNASVATVSESGVVKAVGEGLAIITYAGKVNLGGREEIFGASCVLAVTAGTTPTTPTDPTPPTGPQTPSNPGTLTITVTQTEAAVNSGQEVMLGVSVTGLESGHALNLQAESLNTGVAKATIDSMGTLTITGVSKGTTKINIKASYSDNAAIYGTAAVIVRVDGDNSVISDQPADPTTQVLTLSKTSVSLQVGAETVITATVTPASDKDVLLLSCSDNSVATAKTEGSSIRITGVAKGSAVLTVTCVKNEKEYKATCTIVVGTGAREDKVSKLKDDQNRQVYVMDNGVYREAVYADYFTADKFYLMTGSGYTGWQTIGGKIYYFDANGNKVTGEQVIQGARYTFDSNGVLITSDGSMGIDVSKWNGKIDWAAVKNSGISYVIIRCGYRGSSEGALIEDSMFTTNIKGASEAGLKVGVYFFTQAVDEVEAVYEASYVIDKIKNYRITYPVFLDVEPSGGRGDKIDKATRTAVCKAFCETIQNAGYTAGVYANKTWLTEKMDANVVSNYKIWLAQYAAKPTYTGRYDIWQYKSTGRVSGIEGDVDLNSSYLKY